MPTDGMVHPKGTMLSGWIRMVCSEWRLLGMSRGIPHEVAQPARVWPDCPHRSTRPWLNTCHWPPEKWLESRPAMCWTSPATTGQWWLLWRILAERLPGQFDSLPEMVMTSDSFWVKLMKYCWLWAISNYPKFLTSIIEYDILWVIPVGGLRGCHLLYNPI